MAKMTKTQVMGQITKVMKEKVALVSEDIQAEYDFLIEEFTATPKNVTGEDIQHFLNKLKEEGLLNATVQTVEKEKPSKTVVHTEENSDMNNNNEKEDDEEMAKKLVNKSTNKDKGSRATHKANKTTKKGTAKVENQKKVAKKKTTIPMTELEYDMKPFKEVMEVEGVGTLRLRSDLVTLSDLAEAFEDGTQFIVANAWVKDMLEEYEYDPNEIMGEEDPDAFTDDVDLLQVTFANDLVMYGVSLYTSVHTTYPPTGFETDETGLRNNGFLNYQVYEIEEVDEE